MAPAPGIASRAKSRLLLGALLGATLGFAAAQLAPRLYASRTEVLVRDELPVAVARPLETLASAEPAPDPAVLAQELRSTAWIREVLKSSEWDEYLAVKDDPAGLHRLVAELRSAEHFDVEVVGGDDGDRVVRVEFRWNDPNRSRDFVLKVREHWFEQVAAEADRRARRTVDHLRELLAEREHAYEEAAAALDAYEAEQHEAPIADDEGDARLKVALSLRCSELRAELSHQTAYVDAIRRRIDATAETLVHVTRRRNPEYDRRRAELEASRMELRSMSEALRETHPKLGAQRRRVADAEQAFDAVRDEEFIDDERRSEANPRWGELDSLLTSVETERRSTADALTRAEEELGVVSNRILDRPTLMRRHRLLRLEHDRAQEAVGEVRFALTIAEDELERRTRSVPSVEPTNLPAAVEVLEEPIAALDPVDDRRVAFALGGLCAGLAAALLSVMSMLLQRPDIVPLPV